MMLRLKALAVLFSLEKPKLSELPSPPAPLLETFEDCESKGGLASPSEKPTVLDKMALADFLRYFNGWGWKVPTVELAVPEARVGLLTGLDLTLPPR